MSSIAARGRAPRQITGRTVLICLLAFFGVIFAMNFVMVRVALSSFSGVGTESAYKAGLNFKNDVAAAHAQDALHWRIDASLDRKTGGTTIVVTARDAEGKVLSGLRPDMRLAHPTDKRRDVPVEFVELSSGLFRSMTPLPEGQWDLMIGFKRDNIAVFRSKSRISL